MASSLAMSESGLKVRASPALLSSGNAFRGAAMKTKNAVSVPSAPARLVIRARTEVISQRPKKSEGAKFVSQPMSDKATTAPKKLKVYDIGGKLAKLRDKVTEEPPSEIKLLSRVQQLRLLSKAEKAGLLSAAEKAGFSLSSIEKLGLLSKAESFGALSAAVDPRTPTLLLGAALGLLVLGPAFVYFVPEDSTPLVVLQVFVALVSIVGGSAAFAASSFVSTLQSTD